MTRLEMWCALWWAAAACCLAAPKLHLDSPEGTGGNRNDTLTLETENEESILTQVSFGASAVNYIKLLFFKRSHSSWRYELEYLQIKITHFLAWRSMSFNLCGIFDQLHHASAMHWMKVIFGEKYLRPLSFIAAGWLWQSESAFGRLWLWM